MKIKYLFFAAAAFLFGACSEDELDSKSIFSDESVVEANDFDKWLEKNYVEPYNIQFKYRFEYNESDKSYNLAPADYNKSIALAKLTKYLWIESYEELMGKDFIRSYCPKIMHLVGSPAYDSRGSVTLGTAEGGMKITLYNVNSLNYRNPDVDELNYWYFKTMHHEFAHILHQTKSFSTDFNEITAPYYQSESWVNVDDDEALDMGFVSPYASKEPQEDFVEIIAIYVTNSAEYWDALVGSASAAGQYAINAKLEIVKDYLLTTWGFELDALRDIVQRRSNNIDTLDLQSLN